MEKIGLSLHVRSIKSAFILYIVTCLCVAAFLSAVSFLACQNGQFLITEKYAAEYDQTIRDGSNTMSSGNHILYVTTFDIFELFSPSEKFLYDLLGVLMILLIPFWFALCIVITSILFYRRKFQTPLGILNTAAENIANHNLDFTVSYPQDDELGRLCASFEKMRAALLENNLGMWRQIDERKRLNAAFSHDLRTPLTVLKGQTEMLIKYVPDGTLSEDKIVSAANKMKQHVSRLEHYVSTMNALQRLEDIEIDKKQVPLDELIQQFQETARMICSEREFRIDSSGLRSTSLLLDTAVVMQVYDNLLANAVRFSRTRIVVTLTEMPFFTITLSDDGKGFESRELTEAAEPFYMSSGTNSSQHFGMGLHICKVLCERHGGGLTIMNGEEGAAVKACF